VARKRFLTPDIWSDSFFVKLSPQERLLFIGMITLADDEGRLRAAPSYLKGEIFPEDRVTEATTRQFRDRITALNRSVQLYKAAGMEYVQLRNWSKYQRPSHPSPSRLPAPRRYKKPPISSREDREENPKKVGERRDLGLGVGRGMGLGKGSGSNPPVSPPKGGHESFQIKRVSLESQNGDAVNLWDKALAELQLQVTKPNYETWLKGSAGYVINDDKLIVVAANEFAVDWLSTKLGPLCAKTVSGLAGKPMEVEFVLEEESDGRGAGIFERA